MARERVTCDSGVTQPGCLGTDRQVIFFLAVHLSSFLSFTMSSRRASDPFKDHNHSYNNHPQREDMLAAVRDAVTVKSPPQDRTRPSKTHHTQPSDNATPTRQRRSHSTDSPPVVPDKSSKQSRPKPSKKASMHADAIDRLDISGVGFAMLHHDGPFDACAPSRNKHKHKAPMLAWSPSDGPPDLSGIPDLSAQRSPMTPPSMDSPYAMAHSGVTGIYPAYASIPSSLPKKRVDALAEAWGVAEPEPFEEFSAGGGERSAPNSIRNGKEPSSARRVKESREAYRDIQESNHRLKSRPTIPPPQPISLPGSRPTNSHSISPEDGQYSPTYYTQSDGGRDISPRRTKSLIARIKKMRDAPNVPVSYDEGDSVEFKSENPDANPIDLVSATPQTRPTHRHQSSFLGLFKTGGTGSTPVSPTYPGEDVNYAYSEDLKDKDLPPTPMDYFGDARRPGTAPGLGRRTSLMNKIKGVRNRNNSKS